MKIINLGEQNSVLNTFIAEIRDHVIQKDSMRFRRNLERIGEVFAYEISKVLPYKTKEVQTPLGIASCNLPDSQIVIGSIMRAGLPLHEGLLHYFEIEYSSSPSIEGKTLILADTMLATGSSVVLAYNKLAENAVPEHTHLVCPIASVDGINYLSKHLPHKDTTLWVGAIDEELTIKSYIVPGLGDAGDLAYGSKL